MGMEREQGAFHCVGVSFGYQRFFLLVLAPYRDFLCSSSSVHLTHLEPVGGGEGCSLALIVT